MFLDRIPWLNNCQYPFNQYSFNEGIPSMLCEPRFGWLSYAFQLVISIQFQNPEPFIALTVSAPVFICLIYSRIYSYISDYAHNFWDRMFDDVYCFNDGFISKLY